MSKDTSISCKGLTSPVGKSLLTAFTKTIDRMEARIREKSLPAAQVDRQEEILRAFNINLESHFLDKPETKHHHAEVDAPKDVQFAYKGRSESVFLDEHRRICNRASFHMMFTDSPNVDTSAKESTSLNTKKAPPSSDVDTLGRFEDSEHSSDDNIDSFFERTSQAVQPSAAVLDSCDEIFKHTILEDPHHHGLGMSDNFEASLQHDVDDVIIPSSTDHCTPSFSCSASQIQTPKQSRISSASQTLQCEQRKFKPMKFHTFASNNFSLQTAAENREYTLGMIGAPHPANLDKITARRYYIESCEQQKITPLISHISKCQGNKSALNSIQERTTALKGLGEKRLVAVSQFIKDRLSEDGSQLILRESFIGNDGCKILRSVATDPEIPCKVIALDLSENRFNAIGVEILGPLLTLSTLTRVVLSKLNLGDSGICALCGILCQNNEAKFSKAISVHQSSKDPSPRSPKVSSACCQSNIEFLDLSHNMIRVQGSNSIAQLIAYSKSLVHLELGWNAFGPSGSSAIEKSLLKNSCITYLGLSRNGLDESGGISMAALIGASKFLQVLDICYNRITMIATCLISSALRQNTTLKVLNMAGNFIGKSGCKSLFRVIRWQQSYRHTKYLEQVESAQILENSLSYDHVQPCEIIAQPAASVNVDCCIFEDQSSLELDPNNCNGIQKLNLKNARERAKLAELMEITYVAEPLPTTWSNCFIDGRPTRMSISPSNHSMPPSSGIFEGNLNITIKACDALNCIDSSSFSIILLSLNSLPHSATNVKVAVALSHISEFVYFSSQQVCTLLSCFDEPEAHYKILLSVYCRIVDIQQKQIFIKELSLETTHKIKHKLGQLFDFCADFPMRHYRIDLSKAFDVELFQKVQSTSAIQRRLAGSIRLPDTSQYPLIPMCIRNVLYNGIVQKDFALAYSLPKSGIVDLDFTSILNQIPDRLSALQKCSDASFMIMHQKVFRATSNANLGLDVLSHHLDENCYSITTKQALFLIAIWPPILVSDADKKMLCESVERFPRLDALVHCYSHICDLENLWPTLRNDSDYNWKAIQLICCRIGWLNIWNPLDADGYYELDLSCRDQKIVTECLVVLSVKEPGEKSPMMTVAQNWQDETFNGQRFELPVTWVAEVPDRGVVTLTYTSGLKKRNMLIEIRKQLANRCLVRYCINKLPKNEEDMIEEERKMQEMASNAAATALAQGYADLAEDDESKELQELILKHTDAIMQQEGVIAAIQTEMELRMMDDVQKYIELKKKLTVELEILEKQRHEVNIVIEEAKRKVSAEALETFGIEAQEGESQEPSDDNSTSLS